jgi:hypothetical protein
MAAIILTARSGLLLAMDFRILLPGMYLAGSLLVAAAVIALVRRWWLTDEEVRSTHPGDQLAHYRTLYEQGGISEEEFKRLRGLLGGELRQTIDLPAMPAPPGPKPVEPGPPGSSEKAPGEPKPPPNGIAPA